MSACDTEKQLINKLIEMLEKLQQNEKVLRTYSRIEEEKDTNENNNNKAI